MLTIEKFLFGKYKNKSIKYVMQIDLDYIIWIKKNTDIVFSNTIENELKRLKITI